MSEETDSVELRDSNVDGLQGKEKAYADDAEVPAVNAGLKEPKNHIKRKSIVIVIVAVVAAFLIGASVCFAIVYPIMNSRISSLDSELDRSNAQRAKLQSELDQIFATQDGGDRNSASSDTSDMQHGGKIGDTLENNGIRMKLDSTGDQATISYDTCGKGCSNGIYAPKAPDANSKYWVANVEITNTGRKPIDISCSYPLDIKALNSSGQEFSHIEDIGGMQGNPECNAQLQPGMTSKVSYPFMVPANANIVGLKWQGIDTDNLGSNTEYEYFKLS